MATEKRGPSTCCFSKLPEDCVCYVLSLTSPRDVCMLSLVSKSFLAAAQIDLLWESFLPPDFAKILSRATDSVHYSSRKELYIRLCQPLLLDNGKLSFQLERSTGKKTYMLSPEYIPKIPSSRWRRWISLPHSRFSRQAELLSVFWLEIACLIDGRLLSQRTMYTAYMIFKLNLDTYGLDSKSQKASIKLGAHSQESSVSLVPDDDEEFEEWQIRLREDGWLEMMLGRIYHNQGDEGEGDANTLIQFLYFEDLPWKEDFVFAGFEMRPTKRMVDAELLR